MVRGCGKSSLVRQLAVRLNYPVFEITEHERLEISDLIGHLTVQNGSMKFEDGPLTMAMRVGGLFQFNEIDLCLPATLAGLNTILDGCLSAYQKMEVNVSFLRQHSVLWQLPTLTEVQTRQDGIKAYYGKILRF